MHARVRPVDNEICQLIHGDSTKRYLVSAERHTSTRVLEGDDASRAIPPQLRSSYRGLIRATAESTGSLWVTALPKIIGTAMALATATTPTHTMGRERKSRLSSLLITITSPRSVSVGQLTSTSLIELHR